MQKLDTIKIRLPDGRDVELSEGAALMLHMLIAADGGLVTKDELRAALVEKVPRKADDASMRKLVRELYVANIPLHHVEGLRIRPGFLINMAQSN